MAGYFSNFPFITYGLDFKTSNQVNVATNIFYRNKFREAVKNQSVPYYLYTVRDQDTPDSVAYKYYGDPMAYWIIMFANDMVDPIYDWPLSIKNFNAYIKEKYGSIETAKITIHHYEKVITLTDSASGEVTTRRYEIDQTDPRTVIGEAIPYEDWDSLAVDSYPNIGGTFADGSSVTMVISRSEVSVFDWEDGLNEAKRNIKLVRNDFYPQIAKEMEDFSRTPYFREIRNY